VDIYGEIKNIEYTPLLFRDNLNEYALSDLDLAFRTDSVFMLNVDDKNKVAVSWWVSAKRTRSYPFSRVYNTLGFSGKRVTIIPIFKDEGIGGDRDFIQWDTVSLMSLLGVNVIIAYYKTAEKNPRFDDKITNQRFDVDYVISQIKSLMNYQSDPLHWNLKQLDNIGKLAETALEKYSIISDYTNVYMKSKSSALSRINTLKGDKDEFMKSSRKLAKEAQHRETLTIHKNESISYGEKATITINNYLGGCYYFTADEAKVDSHGNVYLVEAKNSTSGNMPSIDDIKEGLIKMVLFCNLFEVSIQTNY